MAADDGARRLVTRWGLLLALPVFLSSNSVLPVQSAPSGASPMQTTAPRAVLRALVELPGCFLPQEPFEPWSPDGRYLIVRNMQGVHLLDRTLLKVRPRLILAEPRPAAFAWSPDSRWLLCKTEEDRSGIASLVAMSVDGARSIPILQRTKVSSILFWGSDGHVYSWSKNNFSRETLDLPKEINLRGPFERTTKLIRVSSLGLRRLESDAHGLHDERAIAPGSISDLSTAYPRASFPDGRRFLILIDQYQGSSYSAVINDEGRVLHLLGKKSFDPDQIYATSVTPDGRFIIGFRSVEAGDQGVVGAPIFLVDPQGTWIVRVEGGFNGSYPRCSPKEYVLAFEDPVAGKVVVCSLNVQGHDRHRVH